jgi:nucleoside-diphosphate-sugar epimerase
MGYKDKLPVTILRPSAVYGPRDREFLLFFRIIKKGFIPYWGDGKTSMLYVDDLINAIILAAEKQEAVGNTYFISDGYVYTNKSIIHEIGSTLNKNPRKIRVPRAILPIISFFSERISKIMGNRTMINKDKIKELLHKEWICDITRAKNELGFKPQIPLKKGVQWTANWYRIHKWL